MQFLSERLARLSLEAFATISSTTALFGTYEVMLTHECETNMGPGGMKKAHTSCLVRLAIPGSHCRKLE